MFIYSSNCISQGFDLDLLDLYNIGIHTPNSGIDSLCTPVLPNWTMVKATEARWTIYLKIKIKGLL